MSNRYDSNVIDLAARRRCQLEARGLDPIAVAVHVLAETGTVMAWPVSDGYDDGDGGWAA
ncbi:hypothetical protein IU449_16230 [Nocardia higoensis]|uniref:Uncharacterized protein n=1 Tax=Nocardia higoensis TaxID=228599 RepID=A0ABS0DC83_9NOCA|nr:hypothetical protein [Nocardia higoensis]MBF6356070.1 hypothetical protein [Nocardia higoensis]